MQCSAASVDIARKLNICNCKALGNGPIYIESQSALSTVAFLRFSHCIMFTTRIPRVLSLAKFAIVGKIFHLPFLCFLLHNELRRFQKYSKCEIWKNYFLEKLLFSCHFNDFVLCKLNRISLACSCQPPSDTAQKLFAVFVALKNTNYCHCWCLLQTLYSFPCSIRLEVEHRATEQGIKRLV